MNDDEIEMYHDDPANRPTQLREAGGAYHAVGMSVQEISDMLEELRAVPEILATDAPAAYARRVLPTIATVRREIEWLERVIADSQLMYHQGRSTGGAMTQAEIGDALGIARTTVGRWKRGGPLRADAEGRFGRGTLPDGRRR